MTLTKETITNERIQTIKKERTIFHHEIDALCDLALLAVALKPRPIEDAPKNVWGIGLVAGTENSGQMCMLQYEGPAKLASNGACIFHPTHFIPLSALAALMEGK